MEHTNVTRWSTQCADAAPNGGFVAYGDYKRLAHQLAAAQEELEAIRKDADFYQDRAHDLRAELSSVKAKNVKLRDLVKQVIDEDEGMYVMGKAWHPVNFMSAGTLVVICLQNYFATPCTFS